MADRDKTIVLLNPDFFLNTKQKKTYCAVLPAKSDSDVMFCLQCYGDLESIDHLCLNPIHRIGFIHK